MKRKKKKSIKPRSFGIVNYLGQKIKVKIISLKEMPGWEGWVAHKNQTYSYVLGPKGVIVGWLRPDVNINSKIQIFTFKNDMSNHPAEGWDITQAMRYAYLLTQKQKR